MTHLLAPPTVSVTTAHGRRRWLILAAGLTSGLVGAGAAWWRYRPAAIDDAALSAFWGAQFQGLDDAPVAMQRFRGQPLLLNFWATWCPPCIEELPLLNAFYASHRDKGWQVVGMAIDQPGNVRKFLQHTPLDFPLLLGGLAGTEHVRTLGNAQGGLPFSVLFAADGNILQRKIGMLTERDLQDWSRRL